jgi:MFS family permease
VFGLAFLVGPILGGVLLLFSWHWLFLVNLPIGVAIIIAGFRILPASGARWSGPFDWPGMLLLSAILTTLIFGLNRIDTARLRESLARNDTWPLLVACLVFMLFFIRVELAAPNPVVQVRLFTRRQVVLVALLAMGAGVAEAAVVFVPQLLKANFNVSASAASFMLVPLVVAMSVTSPTAGRFVDHIGSRPVLIVGSALLMLGMLLTGVGTLTLPQFYVASILTGMGLASMLGAPLRYIVLNEASAANTASAQGALTLLISIGQLSGGVLMGAVAQHRGGGTADYQTSFALVGALGLLLTLTALLLKTRNKEKADIAAARSNSIMADITVDRLEYAVGDK